MNRQRLLQATWNESIRSLPRNRVEHMLQEIGFSRSMYRHLKDEELRKLLFGFMTRLDEETLEDMIQYVKST
ncbi:hypothetical protein DNHGIG_06250 [Collibacillus ludicampi]|uniref:Uncharacterized protein n=1 Tax=Collibacillus ludicampi TaxID=2771369 RepID=A0AAV4LBG1_9BACL|nr:hypothetical protein [Collibacillus ludicampi]GIM45076.1 hypothetical protein DNHGIG_06250 [Collibacillus ludicampi]